MTQNVFITNTKTCQPLTIHNKVAVLFKSNYPERMEILCNIVIQWSDILNYYYYINTFHIKKCSDTLNY